MNELHILLVQMLAELVKSTVPLQLATSQTEPRGLNFSHIVRQPQQELPFHSCTNNVSFCDSQGNRQLDLIIVSVTR